ncbi:hypothetical protein PR048_025144 [Dryococelus australis]|uniref:Uncharacterized protein n=1 Tax=Dryococelus australis TaxID=614101 RepID=A0ABQ9GQM7_9NEOP|nr:hypothetical protein PR048_025144 [Dryococelus australis]
MRVIEVNMERSRNEGGGEQEIPEKTRRPTASSGTIPTCENPVTRLGIEPGLPWWEESVLIAQPPSSEPKGVIKVNMERRRSGGAGETGDPREDPLTNGIVRHDSHLRESGSPAGD